MDTLCRVATTENLPGTYADGSNPQNPGIGATFTLTATGTPTIDGEQILEDMIVLLKDQLSAADNGIYVCSTEGDVGVNAVFTRYPTFYTPDQINTYGQITVEAGDVNFLTVWITTSYIVEVGVSSISIAQVNDNLLKGIVEVTGASYSTALSDNFLVCTRVGTISILISDNQRGKPIVIKDNSGAASVNNITITPSFGNIDGAANYVINVNHGSVTLVWNGAQYNVI